LQSERTALKIAPFIQKQEAQGPHGSLSQTGPKFKIVSNKYESDHVFEPNLSDFYKLEKLIMYMSGKFQQHDILYCHGSRVDESKVRHEHIV
jgi:hypothetical protein